MLGAHWYGGIWFIGGAIGCPLFPKCCCRLHFAWSWSCCSDWPVKVTIFDPKICQLLFPRIYKQSKCFPLQITSKPCKLNAFVSTRVNIHKMSLPLLWINSRRVLWKVVVERNNPIISEQQMRPIPPKISAAATAEAAVSILLLQRRNWPSFYNPIKPILI